VIGVRRLGAAKATPVCGVDLDGILRDRGVPGAEPLDEPGGGA
jgi:hypothetical protein